MFKKLMGTKSKRSKNSSVRTFKVVNAVNTDGCATKFKHGRYTGNPQSAARKAFTRLCNLKNVKGKCTLYITVQETTQGSGKVEMNNDNNKKGKVVKKQKSYLVERVKLKEPVVMFEGTDKEFKREYATKSKSVKSVPACGKKRPRTKGVMKKTSRRANSRRAKSRRNMKKRASGKKSLNNNLNNNNRYKGNQNGGKRSKRNKRR